MAKKKQFKYDGETGELKKKKPRKKKNYTEEVPQELEAAHYVEEEVFNKALETDTAQQQEIADADQAFIDWVKANQPQIEQLHDSIGKDPQPLTSDEEAALQEILDQLYKEASVPVATTKQTFWQRIKAWFR